MYFTISQCTIMLYWVLTFINKNHIAIAHLLGIIIKTL
jgi:hypothetical protein